MCEPDRCFARGEDRPCEEIARYMADCRSRIPAFVSANYGWPAAVALNRRALGTDILVAPFNFLMGFPNFVLQLAAILLRLTGWRRPASALAGLHLGWPTAVQRTISDRLATDLLQVARGPADPGHSVRQRIRVAADEPVRRYVQTRNVAADITAGSIAAALGLLLLHQFTPGSISVGAAVAQVVAREQAVAGFPLGETLGQLFYAAVPVTPSVATLAVVFLVVTVTIAVVAALSGLIHDPLQAMTGIHRRRLHRMLDAVEASARTARGDTYRPRDTFFGRVYDLVDWVKGLLSF